MHLRLNRCKKAVFAAFAVTSLLFSSCGNKDKDKADEEPVKQPVEATAPQITSPAPDALDAFRTPNDDRLPTDAQLAEGAVSSVGTVGTESPGQSDTAPSTAIKPPAPKSDEDQLAPGE